MQLLSSFDQDMWVEKTPIQTLVCQLSSTLMQILFPFDRGMRFEKTLIKTLTCQLPCNSCSCLTRTWELRKLSYKLSLSTLINSQVTLVPVWLEHESWGNTRPKSWPCDTKLKYPEKHAIFGGPLIDISRWVFWFCSENQCWRSQTRGILFCGCVSRGCACVLHFWFLFALWWPKPL